MLNTKNTAFSIGTGELKKREMWKPFNEKKSSTEHCNYYGHIFYWCITYYVARVQHRHLLCNMLPHGTSLAVLKEYTQRVWMLNLILLKNKCMFLFFFTEIVFLGLVGHTERYASNICRNISWNWTEWTTYIRPTIWNI